MSVSRAASMHVTIVTMPFTVTVHISDVTRATIIDVVESYQLPKIFLE